jgi:curved DNA-binding protein
VNFYTAILGGEVYVPTLAGDVKLRIPAGTQSGKAIRITGRGMPRLRQPDEKGDLYARVLVQVPTNLSADERLLFEQLASMRQENV